ncbi:MAG: hypothetical protein MUC44_06190 [Beijerinckiaceae bacterium]|nr:hypothetical protein [Beijerinckiaceae bacterium]
MHAPMLPDRLHKGLAPGAAMAGIDSTVPKPDTSARTNTVPGLNCA